MMIRLLLVLKNIKQTRALLLAVSCLALSACKVGGAVMGASILSEGADQVLVTQPTVALPATNPYFSQSSVLTITGTCMIGHIVHIEGATQDQQPCDSSLFSFTISNSVDGVYNYLITQENTKGQFSKPAGFVWVRKTSVSHPIISAPTLNPFLSSTSAVLIKGYCETGSTVSLTGDGVGSTLCVNSEYQINLIKSLDGIYSIGILQTDQAGNSASTPFVWNKSVLLAAPAVASIPVDTLLSITPAGGSGVFTISMEDNFSGGTLDAALRTYRTGTIANVVDRIKVQDSVGSVVYMNITVVAGNPDHLEFEGDSGNEQTQAIGLDLTLPLKVKVTDAFGNGISNYPVYFQTITGNHQIVGSPTQFTSLTGQAQISVRAGASDVVSQIKVGPFLSILPDVNNMDSAILTFKQYSSFSNHGAMGSTFGLGQNPIQVISKDLNGDGKLDLIVLNSADPSVGILIASGGGLYRSMTKVNPICLTPNAIELADMNEDSNLDIIITCGNSVSTALQFFSGNGDGTFNPAVNIAIDPSEYIPTGLAVADLDQDGHLDLISTAAGSAMIFVRRGHGDGTFAAAESYAVGGSPNFVKVLKVNNDSYPDLVVLNSADNNVSILMNNGAGLLVPLQVYDTGAGPISIATGDFNEDGFDDFAVANNVDSSITVLMNTATNDFYESVTLASGVGTNAISTFDFDNDGKSDLVVSNGSDETISIFKGAGTGQFSSFQVLPVGSYPANVTVGDANGDNFSDVIVINNGNRNLQIVPNQAGTQFGYQTPTSGGPLAAAPLRINPDGFKDVVFVNSVSKTAEIFTGQGNGLFSAAFTLPTFDSASKVIADDTRKNGFNDIIVNQPNFSKVRVFLAQTTGGGFDLPADYTVGTNPSGMLLVDINEDGNPDLIVTNAGSNTVSVLLGLGDGSFQNKTDFQVGDSPSGLAFGDFNSDHHIDLAVTNKNSGSVSILLGNGNGTFQVQVTYSTGTTPVAIKTADVNHDGCSDVITTNNGDGTMAVLRGRCDGSFQAPAFYSAGIDPAGLTAGDFNGDTFLDFAVANPISESITILYSNSLGQFNTTANLVIPGSVLNLLSVDINKDSATDLILIDQSSSKFHTLLGH